MSDKITAMTDAYIHMTAYHHYEDGELDFYLQFTNPLEVVGDDLHDNRSHYAGDIEDTMESIYDRMDSLSKQYPFIDNNEKSSPEVCKPPEKSEQPPAKPKTLAEKLQAAQEKVKAQDAQGNKNKTNKRDERD